MQLNEEQQLMVQHEIGKPAALMAGAGSGKTHTLLARINYLITQKQVAPRRILAITFTNKAAREIQARLEGCQDEAPRICTIHSLALSAIRRAPRGFGLLDKITPLDDYDQTTLIKQLLERQKIEKDEVNPYQLLEKVGYHRARGVGFSKDYTEVVDLQAATAHGGYHQIQDKELDIWKLYEQEKLKLSLVDFDDMLHLVVQRGQTDPVWLSHLQRVFDFVLVDEVQDSNRVQWAYFTMLLAPDNLNLTVIGDINQSIYGWNGAEPQLLLNFTQGWRGVVPSLYKLQRNHRSVPEVVKLANRIQSCMTNTVPLNMESFRGTKQEHGQVLLKQALDSRDLADAVCQDIMARHDYSGTAILIRAGSQIRDIETDLVKYRIPYIVRGAMGLLQTEEAKDILAYFKMAVNPMDFAAFTRTANLPKRGVGEAGLKKVWDRAQCFNGDIIECLTQTNHLKLYGYTQVIQGLRDRQENPEVAVDYLLGKIQYLQYLATKYRHDAAKLETKQNNITRLKELVTSLMEERHMTLEDVVFQLTMQNQKDEADGKVVVSTIHAAKGLEFNTVYVMGLYEGSLPHKWSQSDAEIEEERRLFYVACTRAKNTLILGVPGMVSYYGKDPQFVTPSRFLTEIGAI